MTIVPPEVSLAILEGELPGARRWAEDLGITIRWDAEALSVCAEFVHPRSGDTFYLRGRFNEYRALPPVWEFCSADWGEAEKKEFYPKPVAGGTLFHPHGVICAHFNRRAYRILGGPHGDWGDATQWTTVAKGYIKAHTLVDMLQAIHRDFPQTEGRMA